MSGIGASWVLLNVFCIIEFDGFRFKNYVIRLFLWLFTDVESSEIYFSILQALVSLSPSITILHEPRQAFDEREPGGAQFASICDFTVYCKRSDVWLTWGSFWELLSWILPFDVRWGLKNAFVLVANQMNERSYSLKSDPLWIWIYARWLQLKLCILRLWLYSYFF